MATTFPAPIGAERRPAAETPEEGGRHMLGRKDYTEQELQHGRGTIKRHRAAYRKLAKPIATGAGGEKAQLALEEFEPLFFNNMVLVLDRFYVHRVPVTAGKDGSPRKQAR